MNTQKLERSTLSRQSKDKGHPFRVWGEISWPEHSFNETARQARMMASNRRAKAIKASHGPRVRPQSQAEERVKRNGKSKGNFKGTEGAIQVSKGSGNGKTLKTGISTLENLKSETSW